MTGTIERTQIAQEKNGHSPHGEFPVTIRPMDDHNQELLTNVRPPGWSNPEPSGTYNLVVIGAGTAGLIGAIGGAGLGAKVALIERKMVGGDCLNWGCVPSKSIIRPARIVAEIRRGEEMGIHVSGEVSVDFQRVMQRMRGIRAEISYDDSVDRLKREGVELYLGQAQFIGPDSIDVVDGDERRTLHFKKALIATGSSARIVPIQGIQETGFLTNETLFQLTEQPKRLAVIGSGPIGSEMAQTFARLGTEVTVLEMAEQVLVREDKAAAKVLQETMLADGVRLVLGVQIKATSARESGKVIHYEQDGESKELEVDEILLAVGRAPNLDGLDLEAAGVEYHARGVTTDDTLRTSNPDIYASGDVAQKYQFTHMADATSRLVLQNALFPGPDKKLSDLIVPWTTYTDPEIAHVGLYEHQAQEQGIDVVTYVQDLDTIDRSRTDGHTDGFVKIHVRKGSDKILGATIVASEAGEMINVITLAMNAGVGLQAIANMIFPYPVQSEAIKKIADKHNRTRLTPLVKGLFRAWFRWRR